MRLYVQGWEKKEGGRWGGAGTHDNETAVGWWMDSATDRDKEYLCRYLCTDGQDIAWTFIRESYRSVSETSVIQMQVLASCVLFHAAALVFSSRDFFCLLFRLVGGRGGGPQLVQPLPKSLQALVKYFFRLKF